MEPWKYIGFLFLISKSSELQIANDSYIIYTEKVSWFDALKKCEEKSFELAEFDPIDMNHVRTISFAKRKMYPAATEAWVGDYISYEVLYGKTLSREDLICINNTDEPNKNPINYGNLQPYANCSNLNMLNCTGSNRKIYAEIESWPGYSGPQWSPKLTSYLEEFASGNQTTTMVADLDMENSTWTCFLLRKVALKLPVSEERLLCGYINSHKPAILYDNCTVKRSYLCEQYIFNTSKDTSVDKTVTSIRLYVGLCVTAVVLFTVVILVVIIWLRRQQFSFCTVLDTKKGGKKQMRSCSSDSQQSNAGLIFSNNLTTETSTELQGETRIADIPCYAISFPNSNRQHTDLSEPSCTQPDVALQNTVDADKSTQILQNKYLTMNGTSVEENKQASAINNTYDFLESSRSINSSRYKDMTSAGDAGNTTYGKFAIAKKYMYDHTSLRSSTNKEKAIDTSYDHVTMDNPAANTVEECVTVQEKTRPVPAPRTNVKSNVIYDDILL